MIIIMKTLNELYTEVLADDELKRAIARATKENRLVEFVKEQGVDTTADEIKAFLEAKSNEEKELSAEELENAAGGACNRTTGVETVISVFTGGLACAPVAAISAFVNPKGNDPHSAHNYSYAGQVKETDGRLCNDHLYGSWLDELTTFGL